MKNKPFATKKIINLNRLLEKKMPYTKKNKEENKMRDIKIDKLVINCSVGEAGDKVLKAVKVLKVFLTLFLQTNE